MRKFVWLIVIASSLALAACQAQPVETPTAVVTEEPAATPVEAAQPTQVVDYCLQCHTDKDKLIANAKPEVVVEKESTGVG